MALSGSNSVHAPIPSAMPDFFASSASKNSSALSPIDETTPRPVTTISGGVLTRRRPPSPARAPARATRRRRPWRSTSGAEPAVDGERRSVHVRRVLGDEERDRGGDLLGPPDPPRRDGLREVVRDVGG